MNSKTLIASILASSTVACFANHAAWAYGAETRWQQEINYGNPIIVDASPGGGGGRSHRDDADEGGGDDGAYRKPDPGHNDPVLDDPKPAFYGFCPGLEAECTPEFMKDTSLDNRQGVDHCHLYLPDCQAHDEYVQMRETILQREYMALTSQDQYYWFGTQCLHFTRDGRNLGLAEPTRCGGSQNLSAYDMTVDLRFDFAWQPMGDSHSSPCFMRRVGRPDSNLAELPAEFCESIWPTHLELDGDVCERWTNGNRRSHIMNVPVTSCAGFGAHYGIYNNACALLSDKAGAFLRYTRDAKGYSDPAPCVSSSLGAVLQQGASTGPGAESDGASKGAVAQSSQAPRAQAAAASIPVL